MASDPRRMWLAVLTVASANALPAMTVVTLGIVLPEVRASLRLSEVQAGALFSMLFSPIPSQVVALGQDSAESHAAATASGLVMSGYAAAVVVPLVTGAVMAGLRNGVRTMVIVVPVGLLVYGGLIAAVREKSRR